MCIGFIIRVSRERGLMWQGMGERVRTEEEWEGEGEERVRRSGQIRSE